MRVLVADDEPRVRRGLRRMLEEISTREAEEVRVDVVGEAGDGEEVLSAIDALAPDLVFLDIRMPGLDGLAVAELLAAGSRPLVVFATAHDEYAVRAFELQAIDYLMKPFGEERLLRTLRRARAVLADAALASRAVGPKLERFVARVGTAARIIAASEIIAVEAAANYVYLHTGESSALLRASLGEIEARLDPERFYRVHRSWLVCLEAIREIRREKGEVKLRLRDDTEVPLSRSARPGFEAIVGKIP